MEEDLLLWSGVTGEERVDVGVVAAVVEDEMERGWGDLEVEGIVTMFFSAFLWPILFFSLGSRELVG